MDDRARLVEQVEKAYVLLQEASRRALAPTGLTATQTTLLGLLASAPRGGMTVTSISQRLLCTRGNASRLVARLADAGLVATGGTQTDERLLLVRLTTAGRARVAAAQQALDEARSTQLGHLDPSELADLTSRVEQLSSHLEQVLKTC